jgi:CRISPR-associated protein Csx10
MSDLRIQLRLTMLSDWHVGTGAGRPGSVDRLVARDDDGLPFVPAKSLTGVWRDACERLAAGLDDDAPGGWSALVDRIFGDQPALRSATPEHRPQPATLAIRAARMPESLARHLRVGGTDDEPRRLLRDALTFVKPGVKIDSQTGRAQDDHLRFVEMARVNSVLTSRATLSLDGETRDAALALLVAGGLLVERIGGKRRRGAGRCRLEVGGPGIPTPEAAIAWLESHAPPPRAVRDSAAAVAPTGSMDASDAAWVALPYELRLDAPAVVAAHTVGNVIETLDHVPGTLLLPHVTRALAAVAIDVRSAIARGDLRVLPATIRVDGHPGRPMPLALHRSKNAATEPLDVINVLAAGRPEDGAQVKPLREGYVGERSSAGVAHATVRIVSRTHNVVDDERQRPTADVGGVYTYEAIAPATFAGRILLRGSLWQKVASSPDWRKALSGPCRVGRSKKDDYGAATFTVAGEPSPARRERAAGSRLVVWLQSDLLVRDDRLRPDPSVEGLRRALLAAFDPDGSRGIRLEPAGPAFARVRRTESWQQSWGLPRPSLVGLQAGSCVAFSIVGVITADDLARIEAAGIGERTAEGYGQVSFDDPLLAEPTTRLRKPAESAADARPRAAAIASSDPAFPFAAAIEEQAWREIIRRRALERGAAYQELFRWTEKAPPMSQLGGLRSAVSGVVDDAGAKRAIDWLDHLTKNPKRSEKWPSAAFNEIKKLLEQPARVWELLDEPGVAGWPILTEGARDRLRGRLWPTAVRSLVQAAIRACKRDRDRRASKSRVKGG